MPSFAKEVSLTGKELENAYKEFVEELIKEAYPVGKPGYEILRDEMHVSMGAMTLENMEKALTVFKKHEMSFITGHGGAPHHWPCFRVTCNKKVMGTMSYK